MTKTLSHISVLTVTLLKRGSFKGDKKNGTRKDAPSVSELYMFWVDLADQKRMQYSTCRL